MTLTTDEEWTVWRLVGEERMRLDGMTVADAVKRARASMRIETASVDAYVECLHSIAEKVRVERIAREKGA